MLHNAKSDDPSNTAQRFLTTTVLFIAAPRSSLTVPGIETTSIVGVLGAVVLEDR
jgi:hypothetical protein